MKKLMIWFSRIPLVGKCEIRPLLFQLYLSTSLVERRKKFLSITVLLITYIICHLIQARMGLNLFLVNSPVLVKIITTVYLLVNLSASLIQGYLLVRVFTFLSKYKGKYPSSKNHTDYGYYSSSETNWCTIFTLIGQIVFFIFYLNYC